MPWGDAGLHTVALVVYPGAALTLVVGAIAEAALLATEGQGAIEALRAVVARLPGAARQAPAVMLGTALLASLAAAQLAAPVSPVPAPERSLLAATVALAAAMWLAWAWDWEVRGVQVTLLIQGCWLLAMLAPALVSQTLRPQALAAVLVAAGLPLKVLAGLLYLICMPGLMRLRPDLAPGQERGEVVLAARLFLWFPVCGLFTSLFVPPLPDDAAGIAAFLGMSLVVAALTIAQGVLIVRKPEAAGLMARLALPVAAVVIVASVITAAVT